MVENPSTAHGRVNEAMHVAGYAFERGWQKFEWLLEEDRWKQVGDGYDDVNDFLATVKLPKGCTPEQRKSLAQKIKELQPTASQRKIAGTLGVDKRTVGRDLDTGKTAGAYAPPPEIEPNNDGPLEPAPGTYAPPTPEPAGDEVARRAQKDAEKKARKQETVENRDQRREPVKSVDPSDLTLVHADMSSAGIAAGSVDWVITDPPYPGEHIGEWDALGTFAARVLRPGGSLLALSGQYHLPDVLVRLSASGLNYQWMVAYLTPGGQAVQVWPRKVNTFWKPLIWMTKGDYAGEWIGDVTKSEVNDNDKRFHEWGQSESGMADIIGRFTNPGEVICDPFCGGGGTLAAALSLGRRVVGIDVDETAINTCRERFQLAV